MLTIQVIFNYVAFLNNYFIHFLDVATKRRKSNHRKSPNIEKSKRRMRQNIESQNIESQNIEWVKT